MSDEEIKTKAEDFVIKMVQILEQEMAEITKGMTDEELEKFYMYYMAASGKAMNIVEDEMNVDYNTVIDYMKAAGAETY